MWFRRRHDRQCGGSCWTCFGPCHRETNPWFTLLPTCFPKVCDYKQQNQRNFIFFCHRICFIDRVRCRRWVKVRRSRFSGQLTGRRCPSLFWPKVSPFNLDLFAGLDQSSKNTLDSCEFFITASAEVMAWTLNDYLWFFFCKPARDSNKVKQYRVLETQHSQTNPDQQLQKITEGWLFSQSHGGDTREFVIFDHLSNMLPGCIEFVEGFRRREP